MSAGLTPSRTLLTAEYSSGLIGWRLLNISSHPDKTARQTAALGLVINTHSHKFLGTGSGYQYSSNAKKDSWRVLTGYERETLSRRIHVTHNHNTGNNESIVKNYWHGVTLYSRACLDDMLNFVVVLPAWTFYVDLATIFFI